MEYREMMTRINAMISAPSMIAMVSSPTRYIRGFQGRKSRTILLSFVGCRII
jgi:hypothetical protein